MSLSYLLSYLAWFIALAWIWKAISAARGLPRVPNLLLPGYDRTPDGNPSITVIVPARNEAASVGACLESLLGQDYPNLQIIAIDDRSTDSTRAIMEALAAQHPTRLRVLPVTELPPGWLGKTHAMALAARHAIAVHDSDYLLFTDADVFFSPPSIRISLAQTVATRADHFVILPTLILKTPGEGMLLGYLHVISLWATRLWRIEDPKAIRDAIGVGAFNLFRTSAYQQLGGFDALRMEIVEDLTLGRRVKYAGLRQRVAVVPGFVTLHWAAGAIGVVNAMTKNLFAIFRFHISLVFLACILLALFCIGPAVFLAFPATRTPAFLALLAIATLYVLSSRHSRISPWYAALFPISALMFIYSLLRSMFITLKEGGVTWRGTFYSLAELRQNKTPLHKGGASSNLSA